MEGSGEKASKIAEVSADFDAYAGEQIARFNGLSDFLTDSLPIVDDVESCNAALEAAGRPDLAIGERAETRKVESPQEIPEKCNNFMMGLRMYTERIEPSKISESPTFVPITKEELLALGELPKVETFEEIQEVQESGDFTLPFNYSATPVFKPAFLRMLILFPDFTIDLITRMSHPENQDRVRNFEPELFIAHQLMSRLVDANDLYVKRDSGEVNDRYLTAG